MYHRNSIELLATQTIDIWDRASDNQTAHLIRKKALLEHAAHCSTQHNNERLVKLGALMASTGKSEIMAGVFAVASNDFMTEFHDSEEEQEDSEDDEAAGNDGGEEEQASRTQQSTDLVDEAPGDEGPTRRKRGNYRGKKKLFDFEQIVFLKEAQLAAAARALGPIEFAKRQASITKALLSKSSNLKEKDGTEKVSKMMSSYDNERAPNAQEKIRGEDIPPRLLGYFPYRALGMKANRQELLKELTYRNLEYDHKLGVRLLQGILKAAEQTRLEKELASELLARGYQSEGMKISSKIVLLRQDCAEKSESTGGKYSVNFSKFFCKLCPDVDETIFEEQE
jgi:hypothetical protein